MSSFCWITRDRLAELLKLSPETLKQWNQYGFLPVYEIPKHYDSDTVNAFLAACTHNLTSPPTLNDLLNETLVLLKTDEVLRHVHLQGNSGLRYLLQDGRLRGIQLGSAWRFSKQSIETYKQMSLGDAWLLRPTASRILGVSPRTLQQLIHRKRLQCVQSSTNLNYSPVTRQSLLNLLDELLPHWIASDDWLNDRLADERPLTPFKVAQSQLHTTVRELRKILQSRALRYIRPGRPFMIAPNSIDRFLAQP